MLLEGRINQTFEKRALRRIFGLKRGKKVIGMEKITK